jgi:Fe2+ or Zn2+ uptake regulation protein
MSAQPNHEMSSDLDAVIQARLRRADQRYTSGRRAIIELLLSAGHPVSIAEISSRIPDLPRSSAYRNLGDLESAGLVRRVAAHDDFARFELAEELTEHHHHFLCVNCGKVTDFAFASELECGISEAIEKLATSEGFQPQSHRLDVLGLCPACRNPATKAN